MLEDVGNMRAYRKVPGNLGVRDVVHVLPRSAYNYRGNRETEPGTYSEGCGYLAKSSQPIRKLRRKKRSESRAVVIVRTRNITAAALPRIEGHLDLQEASPGGGCISNGKPFAGSMAPSGTPTKRATPRMIYQSLTSAAGWPKSTEGAEVERLEGGFLYCSLAVGFLPYTFQDMATVRDKE